MAGKPEAAFCDKSLQYGGEQMFWLWRSTLIVLVGLTTMVQAMTLSDSEYQRYRQTGLDKPQLSYTDIEPVLQRHRQNPLFRFNQLGNSVLGVPVWQIDIGTGPVKILAWSQMHEIGRAHV